MTAPGPAPAFENLSFRAIGATEDVAQALEAASLLIEAKRNNVTNRVELMAAARAEYARLIGALYAEGYYGGVVRIRVNGREVADISPFNRPPRIDRIEVDVTPGPPYRFGAAKIGPLAYKTELPDGYRQGEVAEADLMRDAVAVAVDRWREFGHAKADLARQKIIADHARDRIDADIRLAPGPKLRFGDLIITGDSRVSDRRIRKIAGLPEGEVFSPDDLDRSGRRLRDTGVFRTAALIEAETPNPDGTLDIIAQIEDRKPRRFGFGAEFATDEGFGLSAFWLHRNIDGEALRFRVEGEVSGIAGDTGGVDYAITADLTRPASFGANTDAYVALELESLDEPDFTSDGVSLEFGIVRRASDTMTYRAGVRFSYSSESDDFGDFDYSQIFLPLGATRDKRDSPLDTMDGHYVDLEIAPFWGFSDSDSGVRATLDARGYQYFGSDEQFVFAARVQAGSIAGASITGVPNDLRFHSGGGGTVRGREYESLGVELANGGESGGRSFLGLQSELRTRVRDNIWAVAFYDWGMVGEDSTPGSDGHSHAGAGLGVRYKTGIGPIRVDVGVPVGGDGEDDGGFQLYIGIGQAF